MLNKMNLSWGPNYLEFKSSGSVRSKLLGSGNNEITLSGTDPSQQLLLKNAKNPVAAQDVATKNYVDGILTGAVLTDASTQSKTGIMTFANTANATTTTNGSLICSGGVGVAQDVHIGGNCNANLFFTTSDAVMKEGIMPLSDALAKLKAVEGAQYKLKNDDTNTLRYGVIAQNLEAAGLGHLVTERMDHKAVDYNGLIGLLISAVNELKTEVEELKKSK